MGYSRSYALLSRSEADMQRIRAGLKEHGFGPEFLDSPPEVMEETLKYIKSKYGSVRSYLKKAVNVSISQQERIIHLLRNQSE